MIMWKTDELKNEPTTILMQSLIQQLEAAESHTVAPD